jgi:opacity protein-like surface antigen
MKGTLLTLLLAGSTVAAFGQVGEVSLSFGSSMLRNNNLGSLSDVSGGLIPFTQDTNFHMSLRMTLNSYRFFGHEFGYNYNHGTLKELGQGIGGMSIHQGFYNFLAYATPEGSKVRPFAAGGVHFSSFFPPGASVTSGNGITKFGFNYGGGIKVRVSDMFLVRVDVRDYTTGKPDLGLTNQKGLLHQLVVSAGLGFAF